MTTATRRLWTITLTAAASLGAASCGGDDTPSGPLLEGAPGGSEQGPVQLFSLRDRETGTLWRFDGRAVSGPLEGKALAQVPAYSAMWFAWIAYWGDTEVYGTEQRGTGLNLAESSGIPASAVHSGGVAPDGIPALTDPPSVAASQSPWRDDAIVFGVVINGEARAYPQNLGWWHEIINDVVGGRPICVTYCPLTGTALVFDGQGQQGDRITFGVSGLLLNSNLIMYDRRDRSTLYPQMTFASLGEPSQSLVLLPVTETTWGAWRQLHPDSQILSAQTGYAMDYTQYPYGAYRHTDEILYPLAQDVTANAIAGLYHPKEMVLGVRGRSGTVRAYPYPAMGEQGVFNESLDGQAILVVWSREGRVAMPFSREVDGQVLTFDIVGS